MTTKTSWPQCTMRREALWRISTNGSVHLLEMIRTAGPGLEPFLASRRKCGEMSIPNRYAIRLCGRGELSYHRRYRALPP
jgi:hypothetical protein